MHLMRRYQRSSIAFALAVTLAGSAGALAQQDVTEDSAVAVVSVDEAYLRSGGAQTYYPVCKVQEGDLVRVVGEKFGWAKVEAVGPVFRDLFAFIKYTKTDTSRFRLATDGSTGLTLGLTDVIAPNLLSEYAPSASWKRIDILQPDIQVPVLETIETERDTFHRIPVPATATLWINKNNLRTANAQETQRFEQILAGVIPADDQPEEQPAANSGARVADATSTSGQGNVASGEPDAPQVNTPPSVVMGDNENTVDTAATDDVATTQPGETGEQGEAEPVDPNDPKARLDKLEASLEKLRSEPIATAEVTPLRELYLSLAEDVRDEDGNVALFAETRAEQLQIWTDLQAKKHKINELQLRAERNVEHADAARTALASSADYTAVGRLAVSTIYDGKGLPQLLRLQDPATGRTVAYVVPDDEFNMFGLLDQLIGVVGTKQYDEGLRLNLVTEIERVDLLARQISDHGRDINWDGPPE